MIPLNYNSNMKLVIATAIVIVLASPIMVVATAGGGRRRLLFGVVVAQSGKIKTASTTTATSTSSLPMLGRLGRIPRGGAVVHESSTLGDLESRIQSGALQEKLSVIDFTATW